MKKLILILNLVLLTSLMVACGKGGGGGSSYVPPVDTPVEDGSVVRGRAYLVVNSDGTIDYYDETAYIKKVLLNALIPTAHAATASIPITYTNAANIDFEIDPSFSNPDSSGETRTLGTVSLANIDDNKLKVCGTGNQKCTQAIIRLYTTGATAGLIHETDGYGIPVMFGAGTIGLGAANAAVVQIVAIAQSKNRLRLADFPSPTYTVTADFSNAGYGNYSMTLVVEYVLSL